MLFGNSLGIIIVRFFAICLRYTHGEILKERMVIFNSSYQTKEYLIDDENEVKLRFVRGNTRQRSGLMFNNHRLDRLNLTYNSIDPYNNFIVKSSKVKHKCALQLGYTNSVPEALLGRAKGTLESDLHTLCTEIFIDLEVQLGSLAGNSSNMSGLLFNNHRQDRLDLKRKKNSAHPFIPSIATYIKVQHKSVLVFRYTDVDDYIHGFNDLAIGHFKVPGTKESSFTITYTGTGLFSGNRQCKSENWKHVTTQHDTTWHTYGGLVLKGLYNLNILDYDLCGGFHALNKYQAAVWLFALLWIISWKSKVGFLMTQENQSKALPDTCNRASTVEHKDFQDNRLEKLKNENDNRIMEINEQLRSILHHLDHKMKVKERKRPHSSI